jgi:putative ABC transport system ATP-binding protein
MPNGAEVFATGISHSYRTAAGDLKVLDEAELHVEPGSFVSIVGPSGAGKSTLLSLLGGLEPGQQGELRVGGQDLGRLDRNELAAYRRTTVGFVFQHFGLLDTLTAVENVAVARLLAGDSRAEARRRGTELLERVGLAARAAHRPQALSGGERQRVAIARALANGPALVLADEPTGNLDEDNGAMVVDLLESITTDEGRTVVAVTHDHRVAERAHHRYRLSSGRLEVEP